MGLTVSDAAQAQANTLAERTKTKAGELSEAAKVNTSNLVDATQTRLAETSEAAKAKASELATSTKESAAEAQIIDGDPSDASASDVAKGVASSITESVKNAAATVQEKAVAMKDQAAEKLQQDRIQQAIGRPVNRVILDKDDEVILNTGDIITYQSVDRADDADVLELLLSSVHDESPNFSKEDMTI